MPVKLSMTVGKDKFEAEGDFTLAEVFPLIDQWAELVHPDDVDRELTKIADDVDKETKGLDASVREHTPTP